MSDTLAEALPKEIARVQAMRQEYLDLPNNAGRLATILMDQALADAHATTSSGDVVGMIRAYYNLQGFTG